MEENNEKYLNVTLKSAPEEQEEEQISISIVGILKNLKRLFALWISVSIILSILALVFTAILKQDEYKKMVSLVSFTYSGVEKGLDPNGNKFNINNMKSPQIIEAALDELEMDHSMLEIIRRNISFEGIIPQDALERITAYKNIFDSESGNTSISAVEEILDVTYYPTQYKVYFDYASTDLNSNQAAALLNKMLECYSEYFLDAYGYNKALGTSLQLLEYQDYDYAEAIDVFDSTLDRLQTYIAQVASADTARFRSTSTGCTFSDLSQTISDIREVNLDKLASDITLNTITKDKDSLLTYYQFKVESLERKKIVCQEKLATVNDSIANYEKNTVMVFGANGTDNMNVSASEASAEYDKLFNQKLDIQSELSTTVQKINLYNKRIERLTASTMINSASKKAKVEEGLSVLNDKVNELIEAVNVTTDEFYRTVVYSKAYNILVPANASLGSVAMNAVKDSLLPVVILDALIFVIYFAAAVIISCMEEYRRNNGILPAKSSKKSPEKSGDKENKNKTEKAKK